MAAKKDTSPTGGDGVVEVVQPVPWYKQLLIIKDTIIVILTPLIFLPIVFVYPSRVSLAINHFLLSVLYGNDLLIGPQVEVHKIGSTFQALI